MERLKGKRTAYRSSVTKTTNSIDEELSKDPINNTTLEGLIQKLTVKAEGLRAIDEEYETYLNTEAEMQKETEDALEFQDKAINGLNLAKQKIKEVQKNTREAVRNTIQTPAATPVMANLPKLNIEKFYGDIHKWQTFWSLFDVSIHQNGVLADVDKFSYLKSYLGGSAAEAISGFKITPENYEAAITLLKRRFDRKKPLIDAHINQLLKLTPIRRITDVTALRKFYDTCKTEVRSLESLGVDSDQYSTILCPIILRLVPKEMRVDLNRLSGEWDLQETLNFIQKEVESREEAEIYDNLPEQSEHETKRQFKSNVYENPYNTNRSRRFSSAATLTTTIEGTTCVFCDNSGHGLVDCKEVTEISKKKEILKRKALCFKCVTGRHRARDCKVRLSCKKCNYRHHEAMCEDYARFSKASNKADPTNTVVSTVLPDVPGRRVILLQTARAIITGPKGEKRIRCLLDTGSHRTFIRKDISRKLGLPHVGDEQLILHTFGKSQPEEVTYARVKLILKSLASNESMVLEVLESNEISTATIRVPGDHIKEALSTDEIFLADSLSGSHDDTNDEITLLLGSDFYWTIVTGNYKRINESLVALETFLGWVVQGPSQSTSMHIGVNLATVGLSVGIVEEFPEVNDCLKEFWQLESMGIKDADGSTLAASEETLIKEFEKTIKINDSRYEVSLPWIEDCGNLSKNYNNAINRLYSLRRRLLRNPQLYNAYQEIFTEYQRNGIIEEISSADNGMGDYYLPHQPVIRKDRITTKTRIVFDGSSKETSCLSLNDCLNSGPNLNPELLKILIRFRSHNVAIMSDVQQAFLQISLKPEDRKATRFLWIELLTPLNQPVNVREYQFARVPFGLTCSPFLLAATVRYHVKQQAEQYPETCKRLNEDLYVDDFLTGDKDDESAYQRSQEAKEIMQHASMSLRKWKSNSPVLRQRWKSENWETSEESNETELPGTSLLKVLGISWDPQLDTFTFEVGNLLEFLLTAKSTKRDVLSAAGRIFDPVGYVTPFTIRIKILFQDIWLEKIGWDENLSESIRGDWQKWCSELSNLRKISIARKYTAPYCSQDVEEYQLHCFSDASQKAYGAALYLRSRMKNGQIVTSLVSSKSRVAPLKKITLPRLELMGALVATRLTNHVKKEFAVDESQIYYWTDSSIVLNWIKGSTRKWKPFVANRTKEIRQLSDKSSWRHCSGSSNPADYLSRGLSIEKLLSTTSWWHGPNWLEHPVSEWPNNAIHDHPESASSLEEITTYNIIANDDTGDTIDAILEMKKFSRLQKLLNVTATVQRVILNAKRDTTKNVGPFTAEDLHRAEIYWIRVVQKEAFTPELRCLKTGIPIESTSSIYEFNGFLDEDGVIRLGGRLQHSTFNFDQKHPILLPSHHIFSDLIIRRAHEGVQHSGTTETLVQIRERYWILKGRQQVKRQIHKCLKCNRLKVKPLEVIPAPLPQDRVTETPPFETTGIDFAGPLKYKDGQDKKKSYIVIFTCAVTRALHLELITDLSTDRYLLAFRRFISRRGVCRTIYSDNGTTFHRADKDLAILWRTIKSPEVQAFFGSKGITWKFIIEYAPWWGGFWERMVRSIKNILKRVYGNAILSYEDFNTILTETEATINSRPLTYLSSNIDDPWPLSPSHFLIGQRLTCLPPKNFKEMHDEPNRQQMTKRWKYRQQLLNQFWKKWQSEYMRDLRNVHRLKTTNESTLKPGDLVLLTEDRQPRQMWKTAIIQETYLGRDNQIRSCELKLPSGSVIRRPVNLLCPLEIN